MAHVDMRSGQCGWSVVRCQGRTWAGGGRPGLQRILSWLRGWSFELGLGETSAVSEGGVGWSWGFMEGSLIMCGSGQMGKAELLLASRQVGEDGAQQW